MVRHLCAAFALVGLIIAWTYPLAFHLATELPGTALGDNAAFLWNFWWMRTALAHHTSYFHTTYLFAPAGTNLTLNTHTAAAAFAGATLLGRLSPVAALNVTTIASLALNGFCAYLLAWRVTRDRIASFAAGLVFGASPYLAAHLNGHFNLTAAWTIPLFALAMLRAMRRSSIADALAAGVILGFTAYVDYYYVIYECVLAVCLVLVTRWQWSICREPSRRHWKALIAVGAIAVVDLVLILATADNFNLRQALGILAVIWVWLYYSPRISIERRPAAGAFTRAFVTIAAAVAIASPLARHAWELVRAGDYATQTYFWRSAPKGTDLATMVLGNPFHSMWGSSVSHAYAALGIDRIESGAWLGVAPVAMAMHALVRRRTGAAVHTWAFIGAVFFVWSLGSHVHVAGINTGFVAPAVLLQFIPVVSNARMPGRAMVVVYLALAMLAAIGLVEWRARGGRTGMVALVVAAIALDFWIAPFPATRVDCPPIYAALRDRPEPGAVAELPLVMGDGLGAMTPVNDRTGLSCQMVHQRPIVGGWVARLSPRVVAQYESDPLLATWLKLSGANVDPAPLADAGAQLRADGIAFIVLNRTAASPELRDHVERQLPVRLIAEQGGRALYLVPQSLSPPVP